MFRGSGEDSSGPSARGFSSVPAVVIVTRRGPGDIHVRAAGAARPPDADSPRGAGEGPIAQDALAETPDDDWLMKLFMLDFSRLEIRVEGRAPWLTCRFWIVTTGPVELVDAALIDLAEVPVEEAVTALGFE